MLVEFLSYIDGVKNPPTIMERSKIVKPLLIKILDFLGDIPNERINMLAALLSRWELHGYIEYVFPVDNVQRIALAGKDYPNSTHSAYIGVPVDYIEHVKADPLEQTAAMVGVASKLSDYLGSFLGRRRFREKDCDSRAAACIAEYALAIRKVARREEIIYNPGHIQKTALEECPNGLASLLNNLKHPTDQKPFPSIVYTVGKNTYTVSLN